MTQPASEHNVGSMTQLWQQMNKGDSKASNDLYSRLLPRMYSIAKTSIGPIAKRGLDADDVVQSAMISFWKYSASGKLSSDLNRDDLWPLVTVFTTRKMKKHLRRESTKKRGSGKVINEQALQGSDGNEIKLDQLVHQMPTDNFDELIEELLAPLDEQLTQIAFLLLSEYSKSEIAEMLDCGERTVHRKYKLIKEIWSNMG